jgi:hypothetical protein
MAKVGFHSGRLACAIVVASPARFTLASTLGFRTISIWSMLSSDPQGGKVWQLNVYGTIDSRTWFMPDAALSGVSCVLSV